MYEEFARDSSRDRRVRFKNEEKIILFPHTFVYVGFFLYVLLLAG